MCVPMRKLHHAQGLACRRWPLPLSIPGPLTHTCRSLLRDYFDAEFRTALEGRLPFPYDLERVVDDFVLFCMLVRGGTVAGLGNCRLCYQCRKASCGCGAVLREGCALLHADKRHKPPWAGFCCAQLPQLCPHPMCWVAEALSCLATAPLPGRSATTSCRRCPQWTSMRVSLSSTLLLC